MIRTAPMTPRADRRPVHDDCRDCRCYTAAGGGAGYGWCRAFGARVKVLHPAGEAALRCRFTSSMRPARERAL